MNKDKTSFAATPAVGGVSLLTVFAVLCLTVFALLSLTTVQADRRVSQAAAQAVSGYYEADCQAQEILTRLRGGEAPEGVERAGDTYTYRCPISQTQTLVVEVRVAEGDYQILRWEAQAAQVWEPDDDMHLWTGDLLEEITWKN